MFVIGVVLEVLGVLGGVVFGDEWIDLNMVD